jgi:hypothetical protein
VWSESVVFLPPPLNKHLGLRESVENLPVQQLISEFTIEAFIAAILPRAARLNEQGLYPYSIQPAPHCFRGKLRTIVRANTVRHSLSEEKIRQAMEHVITSYASCSNNGQALASELVDDSKYLYCSPITSAIHEEIV